MIGRAGRPGFDTEGYAVVMCVEEKKIFYKKVCFTESCLCFVMNRRFTKLLLFASVLVHTIPSGVMPRRPFV